MSARWIEFAALLSLLGALGFRHGVLPPLAVRGVPTADAADRARRLGMYAAVLYLVGIVIRLFARASDMRQRGVPFEGDAAMAIATGTQWGIGWTIGVAGVVVLLLGWLVSNRSTLIGTPLALTGALGAVLSTALTGNAAIAGPFVVSVTVDMVHVAAGGVWIGGLLFVIIAGIPAMRALPNGNRDAAVSALVNSFHPLALVCAPLVVIAGFTTAFLRVGRTEAAWESEYATILLIKMALFVLVALMALYNSVRVRRRLGNPAATGRFRATAAVEIVLAALVVVATTILVATPLPTR